MQNKGDGLPPTVTQDSEGDGLPSMTQASEGDLDTDSLLMPEMINLESAGLCHSKHIASQGKKNYNFFSGISKFCAFGLLLAASLMQPTEVFSHVCKSVNASIHQCNVINANFDG